MTQQMQRNFRLASRNALSARYVGVSSLYYGYYYYYYSQIAFQTGGRFLIINFYRRNLR